MKRLFSILTVIGLMVLFACGGGGNDPKAVMGEFMDLMEGYVDELAKAESADDIVNLIEKTGEKMKSLAPRMKALKDKYPNLKPGPDMPPEFKEFEERMKGLMGKMMGSMGKVMKFMSDPKVQEAQQKFQKQMSDFMK